jgi:uncharacterized protein YdeI (BOF family)
MGKEEAMRILGAVGLGLMVGLSLPAMATSDGERTPTVTAVAGQAAWNRDDDDRGASRRRGRGRVHVSPEDLEGTIWFSQQPHRRASVTLHGDIAVKEGKEVYVWFKDRIDDIFIIEIRWWNEEAKINVLEYGVLTRSEGNQYRYTEADHFTPDCDQPDFPGIIGRGTFELLSKKRAELIQVGALTDGSASGFTTVVERVDTLPLAPIEQTYPLPCP